KETQVLFVPFVAISDVTFRRNILCVRGRSSVGSSCGCRCGAISRHQAHGPDNIQCCIGSSTPRRSGQVRSESRYHGSLSSCGREATLCRHWRRRRNPAHSYRRYPLLPDSARYCRALDTAALETQDTSRGRLEYRECREYPGKEARCSVPSS